MSSSGGGILLHDNATSKTLPLTKDGLREMIDALPDGDLKTKLQAWLADL